LQAYIAKGEIKERYWNPCNFFDEIYVLSPSEIVPDTDKIASMAGSAVLNVLPIGRYRRLESLLGRSRVLALVRSIRPNIIRAYDSLMAGYLATYCGKSLGIPVVLSVHSDFDRDFRYQLLAQGRIQELLPYALSRVILEPYSLKHAAMVIAISYFCAEYAKRLGAKKVSVVYNRVNGNRFKPHLERNLAATGPFRILSVGRLIKEKGHHILIEAITDLNAELTIVGQGPELQSLMKMAQTLGVSERVAFEQKVTYEELPELYRNCDVFAAALAWGGVSIPMLEAMASGVPVVASKTRWGFPECIGDAGIVMNRNPREFAAAFRWLAERPKIRNETGTRARSRWESLYEGNRLERKESEVYEKLVKESDEAEVIE